MLRLLLKDLRVGWVHAAVLFAAFVLYSAQFAGFGGVYALVSVLFTFLLAIGSTMLDWRYHAERLVASLPVRRADIVHARYLGAGLSTLVGLAASRALAEIAMRLFPVPVGAAMPFGSVAEVTVFVVLVLVLVALYFPLFYRLDLAGALMGMAVAVLAGAILASFAAPSVPASAASGSGSFRLPTTALAAILNRAAHGAGWGTVLPVCFGALGALLWLSQHLAVRFFARRDL
jgi:hypothetical protein